MQSLEGTDYDSSSEEKRDRKEKRQRREKEPVELPPNFDPFGLKITDEDVGKMASMTEEERKQYTKDLYDRHNRYVKKYFKDNVPPRPKESTAKAHNHKSKLSRIQQWLMGDTCGDWKAHAAIFHSIVNGFDEMEKERLANEIGDKCITFGKFKGQKFTDLWKDSSKKGGRSYLKWLSKQDDLYGDIVPILDVLKKTESNDD